MMKGRKIKEMGDSSIEMDRRTTAHILPYRKYRRNITYINELSEIGSGVYNKKE
jgi:hypothetical protein